MDRSRFPLRSLALLAGAAALLAPAPAAQAVVCNNTQFVTWETQFQDCAGNNNYLNDQGSVSHDLGPDGPAAGSDWFSDIHIDFPDAVVEGVFVQGEGFFKAGLQGALYWDVEGSLANDVAFVAPTLNSRVFPGDNYDYSVGVIGNLNGLTGLNVYIGYTMDVPEPATAALVAFLALAGLAAARSR